MLNMSLVKLCVVGPPKIAMLLAKMTILYKGQSLNPKLLISSKPLDYLIKKKCYAILNYEKLCLLGMGGWQLFFYSSQQGDAILVFLAVVHQIKKITKSEYFLQSYL